MAKPKRKRRKHDRARRLHQEPIVREVARLLSTGRPTKFRWSSECRYGLRAALCLKGHKWEPADKLARSIVEFALHRIGSSLRPSIAVAQADPLPIEYRYCACCGGYMEGGHNRPWCGEECRLAIRERDRTATLRKADEVRRRATRVILTGETRRAARPLDRLCRKCGKLFTLKHGHRDKRYCGHRCAALREKYPSRDCLVCASPFRPHHFRQLSCGPACASVALKKKLRDKKGLPPLPFERACVICSRPFKPIRLTSMQCSDECRHEAHLRSSRAYAERKRQALAA